MIRGFNILRALYTTTSYTEYLLPRALVGLRVKGGTIERNVSGVKPYTRAITSNGRLTEDA